MSTAISHPRNKKIGITILLSTAISLLLPVGGGSLLYAQTSGSGQTQNPNRRMSQNTATLELREELLIVSDLGRLFGFILRMEQESPERRLSNNQVISLWRITEELSRTERLTPAKAKEIMKNIEDRILNSSQLLYTDQLFLNRDMSRETSREPDAGSGSGSTAQAGVQPSENGSSKTGEPAAAQSSGTIASYVAGGPYNPLLDTSRELGQAFSVLREHLRSRR